MGFLGTSAAAVAGGTSTTANNTLLAATPILSAIGKGAGGYGTASAQQATLAYQQQVAQGNAIIAEYQATDALSQAANAEVDLRKSASRLKGTQRAALAANGVALNEGSPAAVISSTDIMRDADIQTLRNNAARAAWGYRMQATNSNNRAAALGSASQASNPLLSGAASFLGSASTVSNRWYDLYKNGAFGTSAPNVANTPRGRTPTYDTIDLFGD